MKLVLYGLICKIYITTTNKLDVRKNFPCIHFAIHQVSFPFICKWMYSAVSLKSSILQKPDLLSYYFAKKHVIKLWAGKICIAVGKIQLPKTFTFVIQALISNSTRIYFAIHYFAVDYINFAGALRLV